MIRHKFILLTLLISSAGLSQKTDVIHIDRFDNDKKNWGLIDSEEEVCAIENGKLIIENKRKDNYTYFSPENLKDFKNRAYTEISFDFSISTEDISNGGVGMLFINSSKLLSSEIVRLVISKSKGSFIKNDWNNANRGFIIDNTFSTPELKTINNVKIVLNNQDKSEKNSLQLYLNDQKLFESNFNISDFDKIGLLSYGLHQTEYDNLIIRQSEELNYVVDAFDYASINDSLVLDHNGIQQGLLARYIPVEIIDNYNILSTKKLIKSLRNNDKCSNFQTKNAEFAGKVRELFSFNYGNSLIEFFTDAEVPNPIEINFLDQKQLKIFFRFYSEYHSYRFTDKNRSQWPDNPFYSILKFEDSYKATIWRGM